MVPVCVGGRWYLAILAEVGGRPIRSPRDRRHRRSSGVRLHGTATYRWRPASLAARPFAHSRSSTSVVQWTSRPHRSHFARGRAWLHPGFGLHGPYSPAPAPSVGVSADDILRCGPEALPCHDVARAVPHQARLRDHARAQWRPRAPDRGPAPFRRPASSSEPAALRPPPGDRRRTRQLGRAAWSVAPPPRAETRGPYRGPSHRVPRLRGHHPQRRVRGRGRHRLGPRDVGPGAAWRSRGRCRGRRAQVHPLRAPPAWPLRPRAHGRRPSRVGGLAAHPQGRRARRRGVGYRGPTDLGALWTHERRRCRR